jgi:P2 family phage contractile tail tube protein
MGIKINRLTNANIYMGNQNLIGRAEEIDLPELKVVMTEHKALGLVGKLEYPSGIDKLEAKIKWNSFYQDVFGSFANPYQAVKLMVRSSVETYEGGDRIAQLPAVCYMTCQPKGFPLGKFKQHDNVELESSLGCTYIKLEIDGVLQVEFDAEANIFNVQGVDLLATYRANLGL